MRRTPTAEQKAAAAARRARFRELARKVSAMTPEAREQIALRVGIVTCEGHALSTHNTCLIVSQCEQFCPSMVGGFQQWRRIGRCVRKGEHGLMIWFPRYNSKANEEKGEGEREPDELRFAIGYVFDVTQTEEIGAQVAQEVAA